MTGHKAKKTKYKIFSQAGSAMIEFAFVIPLMSLLALSGYNLMRDLEINILKRDFARSLSQSYICSLKQGDAVKACYEDAISKLTDYAKSKDVLGSTNTDGAQNFQYSIHTYALVKPEVDPAKTIRGAKCTSQSGIVSLKIYYVGGYTSDEFANPHYDLPAVQRRAGPGTALQVRHLFDGSHLDSQAQKIICENTQITVTEIHFDSQPIFKYSTSDKNARHFYEFSYQ